MVLDAILFGIMQGIFEWLPISSQGNLILVMIGFFGLSVQEALNYAIFLHIGTLLAAVVYFRKELFTLLKHLPHYRFNGSSENDRTMNFLVIATILSGAIGYPIFKVIETSTLSGEVFIGIIGLSLIITGLIQRYSKIKGHKDYKDLNHFDSLLLGIAQAFSIIPGISRSGITTSSLLLRNYEADTSLRLSFIMSIPVVFGANIALGFVNGFSQIATTNVLIGIATAFVMGLISIHVLIKVARRIRFWKFCIGLGIVSLIPLLFYLVG